MSDRIQNAYDQGTRKIKNKKDLPVQDIEFEQQKLECTFKPKINQLPTTTNSDTQSQMSTPAQIRHQLSIQKDIERRQSAAIKKKIVAEI